MFLFYFIIIHQLHALSHKTKKIYAKSTLRDTAITVKMDFRKNHFLLLALQEAFQLTSCGARIVRMGGGREDGTSLRHLAIWREHSGGAIWRGNLAGQSGGGIPAGQSGGGIPAGHSGGAIWQGHSGGSIGQDLTVISVHPAMNFLTVVGTDYRILPLFQHIWQFLTVVWLIVLLPPVSIIFLPFSGRNHPPIPRRSAPEFPAGMPRPIPRRNAPFDSPPECPAGITQIDRGVANAEHCARGCYPATRRSSVRESGQREL